MYIAVHALFLSYQNKNTPLRECFCFHFGALEAAAIRSE
jgi:hypothetical protein